MASLLPMAVIARHLFNDPPVQHRRPAVTTRQPAGGAGGSGAASTAVPAVSRTVAPAARPSLVSRFAHLVVHPVSAVRSH